VIKSETANENYSKKAFHAATFVILGFGFSQVIRLFSNILLTRLLIPEFFGIMALSQVVFQGLGLFSDLGIGQGIIRSNRADEPQFLNTAWTLQVIRGFVLFLLVLIVAYPVSLFYEKKIII